MDERAISTMTPEPPQNPQGIAIHHCQPTQSHANHVYFNLQEYIPDEDSTTTESRPTTAVISLIIEIQGDTTNFSRAGFSISETKDILSSIMADCRVDNGDCLNAVEIFWTPSDSNEVLTERDTVLDFPELISF